jgi:beta-lactamase superfamily II metal-dependent hydrolase
MASTTVHFLNVGHGDCTIIDHAGGRISMIDINNSKSLPEDDEIALAISKGVSLSSFKRAGLFQKQSWEDYYRSLLVDPADYWKANFEGRGIFRYIQSHPDMDHMSGLFRFFYGESIGVQNFWDVDNAKVLTREELDKSPYEWNDWAVYNRLRDGYVHDDDEDEKPVKTHYKTLGAEGEYWTEDGFEVLSPTKALTEYCDKIENWNNASYILSLTYGGRRVILPGDAEKPAWDSVEANADDDAMECDILKVAHHGRASGYSEPAVDALDPSIVICSVGKKPDTDASDEYREHGAHVLSTRYHGTITCKMWADGEVWVKDRNGDTIASLPILS